MSTCISQHGEFSEHQPDDAYVCELCGALDEDGMLSELRRLRAMTTDPTDRPASTPAPVAVPDVIANAIMVSGTVRVRVVSVGTVTGFMRRESAEFLGHRIADALTAPTELLERRPEPVVAPLRSEAVENFRMAHYDEHGNYVGECVQVTDLPHLRLVPEDDEDTVRVPREAVERLRELIEHHGNPFSDDIDSVALDVVRAAR